MMRAHGQTTVWGNHIPLDRAKHGAGWLQQVREWWTQYKATRRDVKQAALNACWDARREVCVPVRAEAAAEMAATQGAISMATQLYGLSI